MEAPSRLVRQETKRPHGGGGQRGDPGESCYVPQKGRGPERGNRRLGASKPLPSTGLQPFTQRTHEVIRAKHDRRLGSASWVLGILR